MSEVTMEDLFQLPLFEGAPQEEVRWVLDHSHIQKLENSEYFHKEGEPVDTFYVMLEGELQVTRHYDGQEAVIGTTPAGIMGGELALLNGTSSTVSERAILPSRLLVMDQGNFREMFSACPVISGRVFQTAAERTQGNAAYQNQREKMAALGKLSAGLAHELNNPSAAAHRAAKSLVEAISTLERDSLQLGALGLGEEKMQLLADFREEALPSIASTRLLLPLEQSEREEDIGGWLEDQDFGEKSWEMAANMVNAGMTLADLEELSSQLPAETLPTVLSWLSSSLFTFNLLNEIEQSAERISELVGAVKAYTYMDRAPVQEVDIHKGLENTLKVMSYKLRNVELIREYDPKLPLVFGRGGDLNQVWTNLIDNAVDAMRGKGELRLITRCENDFVMVEIADNGPGIPPEVQAHLFEPFYTTKTVGIGTGLGLDTSLRIINQHQGTIEVRSRPGKTRFIVRIPIKPAKMEGESGA